MKKVLLVFGTRPEAIKMAPLIKEFQKYPDKIITEVCVTAQHREMLDQVLQLFDINPDYDLNVMKEGQDLFEITSSVLTGMRKILDESKPDTVLVHGDTTTSVVAALASFYMRIPVGHVEAGLRTYDIHNPWPEEMNRQITGRLSSWHFAPTELNMRNLISEGISPDNIYVTGNTVIDSLFLVKSKIKNTRSIEEGLANYLREYNISENLVNAWKSRNRKLILVTAHRRENSGPGFTEICEAIKELKNIFPDVDIVFPMHLNPNVRIAIRKVFPEQKYHENIFLTEPLNYLPFIYLMSLSYMVLTDSGGIQEEAPGFGVPVLVMRNATERMEALDAGTVRLTGTSKKRIIEEVNILIENNIEYLKMSHSANPYGDGKAAKRICEILLNKLK
jgi:UDP-N-acetylglucosamine 2-epimerase (non-hydrolysing)